MPIESATYINQLNSSYPAATDGVKEGDDHIRLVKQVLKDTFPNITGPVTKTQTEINSVRDVPIGLISMWSGAIGSLPANWALCNGQTVTRTDGGGTITTPDLRDRFVVGAGGAYAIGDTGGSNNVALTEAQIPAHSHTLNLTGSIGAAGDHSHGVNDPGHSHVYTAPTGAALELGTGVTSYNNGPSGTVGTSTSGAGTGIWLSNAGNHSHSLSLSGTANNTGGGQAHENRPPYYALAFIMRY